MFGRTGGRVSLSPTLSIKYEEKSSSGNFYRPGKDRSRRGLYTTVGLRKKSIRCLHFAARRRIRPTRRRDERTR